MKKIIALILALAMVMSMSAGCVCDCDEQIAALQQEITSLKTQIDEQNQLIPEETVTEPTVVVEADDTLLATLTNQVNSGGYDNMYAVAECEYATESHLKSVANYASRYGYKELAGVIEDNPNTTGAVMEELVRYYDYDIYTLVAKSSKASESALIIVANHASDYGYEEFAGVIEDNPNTTGAVMEELVRNYDYDIYTVVAESSKASENALITVANYASHYGYENLASVIINNSNKTLKVLQELSKSGDSEVANLAHKAIESWNE